ncbi:aminotransferase class I/II-fold pyridoxal phosphate-dependent enzyme [Dermacoccus barathri]|uniref:Aminotransferase class I/II-fold pyridoxal phosphate-dependent enzyme n=1 Tax=Dermacoccus abyssi TaxID=322596 RepID=A0ABX5Z6Q7_9MICO|nr:aminotransferase class I/II-fold pyridoxal phosphate-dependent enzyme [Dermacoccus barathri]MBE7370194.1 aminotransferase class I/II-fold pyridoxal phosphate-dependent enzyme [Dermacoccus barathri]QEH92652.1 aminotransferase class I/II-fold pyridoxal phosphate-dependent enzyme [Dermacoccus abyssi]
MTLADMAADDLAGLVTSLHDEYEQLKGKGLKLDLTRGKPSAEQLDLANALLTLPSQTTADGVDVRNYGGLAGLPEIRSIFAELLGVGLDQIVAGNNSSLTMMHDTLVYHLLRGGLDSPRPWAQEEKVRFLAPVPGYDRHFALLESFGIEMITVPMNDDGPDADECARLVATDPSIKGMWVVPTYANPTGAVCSQEVAAALAAMPTAAPDFRIFWDNAYAVHHLDGVEAKTADIVSLAQASGHPNRPIMFASTSKITFAGAGVAFLAGSPDTVAWYLENLGNGSIGPDKVNQLAHAEFFGDAAGVRAHMAKHRDIMAPKFAAVGAALEARLGSYDVARWNTPHGGYFVNLDVVPGTASRVVELAKEAGIALTPAGSSFPYGKDPKDENIRLAPSLPPLDEVRTAMEGVALCVLLAAAEAKNTA